MSQSWSAVVTDNRGNQILGLTKDDFVVKENGVEQTIESLDYFTKNFSPYQHKQVRILEFPGYANFAQSFPNTIPYSETIGFVADLRKDPTLTVHTAVGGNWRCMHMNLAKEPFSDKNLRKAVAFADVSGTV